MNHVSAEWKSGKGDALPYEYWESGQGGYDRVVLALSDPFAPLGKSVPFLDALMARRLKVYSPRLPISCGKRGAAPGLPALASAIDRFSDFVSERESLPLIPFVFSFAALPFMASVEAYQTEYRAAVFLNPLLDWSRPPFPARFFPLGRALRLKADACRPAESGRETPAKARKAPESLYLSKSLAAGLRKDPSLASRFMKAPSFPIAVFTGGDEPRAPSAAIESLKADSGYQVRYFNYPGMRRLDALDAEWNSLEHDLGAWMDLH